MYFSTRSAGSPAHMNVLIYVLQLVAARSNGVDRRKTHISDHSAVSTTHASRLQKCGLALRYGLSGCIGGTRQSTAKGESSTELKADGRDSKRITCARNFHGTDNTTAPEYGTGEGQENRSRVLVNFQGLFLSSAASQKRCFVDHIHRLSGSAAEIAQDRSIRKQVGDQPIKRCGCQSNRRRHALKSNYNTSQRHKTHTRG